MKSLPTSEMRWLPRSQNDANSWHSMLLSALRVFAALQVASGHLRSELFPGLRSLSNPPLAYQGLAFITGFAHQAVVLLFLISGWLVGGRLLDTIGQPGAIKHYVISRAVRLWSVLIPSFFLMLLIGIVEGKLSPTSLDLSSANNYSGRTFVGNLLGLQGIAVDNFGGNYALWTMAHQTWYYVLFPLVLLAVMRGKTGRRICAGLLVLALGTWLPGSIMIYSLVWILGALFSRIRIDCTPLFRVVFCAAAIGTGVYYRLFGLKDDIVAASLFQDLVFTMTVLVWLASMRLQVTDARTTRRVWRRALDLFAGFSFTLYVIHVPLINVLRDIAERSFGISRLSPAVPMHYLVYLCAFTLLLAGSYLWFLAFESRTKTILCSALSILERGRRTRKRERIVTD